MRENDEEGQPKLTEAHLNYILSIYEISKDTADVSSCSIAKELGVSKPSVSAMLSALMARHLLIKERYGKVYLTDDGYAIAMRLERNIKMLEEKIPLMGNVIKFAENSNIIVNAYHYYYLMVLS